MAEREDERRNGTVVEESAPLGEEYELQAMYVKRSLFPLRGKAPLLLGFHPTPPSANEPSPGEAAGKRSSRADINGCWEREAV